MNVVLYDLYMKVWKSHTKPTMDGRHAMNTHIKYRKKISCSGLSQTVSGNARKKVIKN